MAVNTVSDFIIFLWPVIPLWKVQISLRQRLNLVTVFGFGMVTCIGGVVKIHFAKQYLASWDSTCRPNDRSFTFRGTNLLSRYRWIHGHHDRHRIQRRHHVRLPALPATVACYDLSQTLRLLFRRASQLPNPNHRQRRLPQHAVSQPPL